jgi:hypothetical protein
MVRVLVVVSVRPMSIFRFTVKVNVRLWLGLAL